MAYIYTGNLKYPTGSEHESLRLVVTLLGNPGDNMIKSGFHSMEFFTKDFITPGAYSKLKKQRRHTSLMYS